MLSKVEKRVMSVIYAECNDKHSLLVSPADLKQIIGDSGLTLSALEKIVGDLSSDGYFSLVYSDRHGETVFCIELTEKGKGYLRSNKIFRRNLIFRFSLSIILALFSFLIGLILKAIF